MIFTTSFRASDGHPSALAPGPASNGHDGPNGLSAAATAADGSNSSNATGCCSRPFHYANAAAGANCLWRDTATMKRVYPYQQQQQLSPMQMHHPQMQMAPSAAGGSIGGGGGYYAATSGIGPSLSLLAAELCTTDRRHLALAVPMWPWFSHSSSRCRWTWDNNSNQPLAVISTDQFAITNIIISRPIQPSSGMTPPASSAHQQPSSSSQQQQLYMSPRQKAAASGGQPNQQQQHIVVSESSSQQQRSVAVGGAVGDGGGGGTPPQQINPSLTVREYLTGGSGNKRIRME